MTNRPHDMVADSPEALVDGLVAAHRGGPPCSCSAEMVPRGVEGAYRVQERVLRRISGDCRPTAWKVSPPRPGREPLASPVPTQVLRSPATLSIGGLCALGVEAELAFRLGATPRIALGVEEIRAAVAEILVLIEWCETRIDDWEHAPALLKLADFQSHGVFIAGSGTREPWPDFRSQAVELLVAGRPVAGGTGTHPTGDLWTMMAWAVDHCAERGMPLEAGDLVTTGSWTGIAPVARGEQVVARFAGIGEARLAVS